MTSSSSFVLSGGSAQLSWTTRNVDSCTASGSWSGTKGLTGTTSTGALLQDATYTLTCTYNGGSVSDTVNVFSLDQCEDALDNDGDGLVDLLDPGCSSSGDAIEIDPPVLTLSANPISISYNGSTNLSWSASPNASCTASGGWSGAKAVSGTQTINSLTEPTTFTIECANSGGSVSDSESVTVAPAPDFGLYNDGSITIPYGSTTDTTHVKVSPQNGFSAPVTLSVSSISPALPSGVTVSLTGGSLSSAQYGTGALLTATVSKKITDAGPFNVTVVGTDGSRSRQSTVVLDLSAIVTPNIPGVDYTEF